MHANCLISKNNQQTEVQYFVTEFNETFEKLKANVLEANRKLQLNQLKREEIESYIAQHQPIPEHIYSTMCFYNYQWQFDSAKYSQCWMKVFNDESSNISFKYFTGQEQPQPYHACVWMGQKSFHMRRLRNW